jgi:hypothetical protein
VSNDQTRLRLRANGYAPTPCVGKRPVLKDWQKRVDPTEHEINGWSITSPAGTNTGLLTRSTPAFDIDILNEDAAQAVEDLTREWFADDGQILVRIGNPPKRCIPFRTDDPFKKIAVTFVEGGKLEMLGDGQQFVAFGIHPDTQRPYDWGDKSPLDVKRSELPYIHHWEARELVQAAAKLLIDNFGYQIPEPRPASPKRNLPPGESRPYSGEASPDALKALDDACDAILSAPCGAQEGTLNSRCFLIGRRVGAGQLDAEAAIATLSAAAAHMTAHRGPWRGLDSKVRRAVEHGMLEPWRDNEPRDEPLTFNGVMGLAQAVAKASPEKRRALTRWGARRLAENVRAGKISAQLAHLVLFEAATRNGLPATEAGSIIETVFRGNSRG